MRLKKCGRRVGLAAILLLVAASAVCLENAGADSKKDGNIAKEAREAGIDNREKKNTLTMGQLAELCTADNWAQEIEKKGLKLFSEYDNAKKDKENIEESLTGIYHIALDYNNRKYDLQIYYWLAEAMEKYGSNGEIDSVLLVEKETGDAQLLYSTDESDGVNRNIDSFLARVYDIRQYLSFTLPEGLSLGKYTADLTDIFSGHTFEEDGTVDFSDGFVSVSKKDIGGIGISLNANNIFEFKDGKVKRVNGIRQNHMGILSEGEKIENDDMAAYLSEYEFDLFTAAEYEEYESRHNVKLSHREATSRYWYAFLANEGEEETYVAYLNADLFSKKEMKEFVKTIHRKGN